MNFLKSEPVVVWTGLVGAAIDVAVQFGTHITQDQKTVTIVFIGLVLSLFVRSQVTPVAK